LRHETQARDHAQALAIGVVDDALGALPLELLLRA
jgi:hypothetical protein